MSGLVWVVALVLLGLGVMVLEVFVPSGGVLGLVSLLALVAAVGSAFFEQGVVAGLTAAAVVVVAVPAVLALAFRVFPETPLGRRVLPPVPQAEELVPGLDRRRQAREMVGHSGRTMSELLPWGRVEIDGRSVDAVSEGGPLDAGIRVTVVAAQGAAVVVRSLDPVRPSAPAAEPSRADPPAPEGTSALSPALETFDFERLEPPPP